MRRFILGVALSAMTGLSPAWAIAADQDAAQRIAGALRASGRLTDYSIGVQCEEGTVWLSGRVANEQQLEEALELVNQMPDVVEVVNQLEVQATRSEAEPAVGYSEIDADRQQPTATQTGLLLPNRGRAMSKTSQMFGLRRLAPPAKPPASYLKQQQGAKPGVNAGSSNGSRNSSATFAEVPSAPQVMQGRAVPVSNEAELMGDPGDPLASSRQIKFAPSASRRFADDPVMRARNASGPTPRNATRAISYNAAAAGGMQGQVAMSSQDNAVAGQGYPAQAAGFRHVHAGAPVSCGSGCGCGPGGMGMGGMGYGGGAAGMVGGPVAYDNARMPNYAWPSYAAYPNYAAVTYPKQYSATAWPYIGPFYPYPQVPLGWRKVSLEWDDGWWFLDFHDRHCHH